MPLFYWAFFLFLFLRMLFSVNIDFHTQLFPPSFPLPSVANPIISTLTSLPTSVANDSPSTSSLGQQAPSTLFRPTSSLSPNPTSSRPPTFHPIQTWSKSGIVKSRRVHPTLLLVRMEPKPIKQSRTDPTWLDTMQSEYTLQSNNMTFVPQPTRKKTHSVQVGFSSKLKS